VAVAGDSTTNGAGSTMPPCRWLADYVPELIEAERRRYPDLDVIGDALGAGASTRIVPVAKDCLDGFTEAYFARPEAFLEEATVS
jgi:hypothetical protein